jgi:hypothetical protein
MALKSGTCPTVALTLYAQLGVKISDVYSMFLVLPTQLSFQVFVNSSTYRDSFYKCMIIFTNKCLDSTSPLVCFVTQYSILYGRMQSIIKKMLETVVFSMARLLIISLNVIFP